MKNLLLIVLLFVCQAALSAEPAAPLIVEISRNEFVMVHEEIESVNIQQLLFVAWTVVLMALSLVNFRRAKVLTAVFIGILLLQAVLQVALQVALAGDGRLMCELTNTCSAVILLMFIPSLGFFVFAGCRDWKHWLALSAAGAALTCLWFFIEYFPYFIKSQA